MKRLSSKLAAFLLVAVMVVSLFPAAVFAEDTDVEESDTSSTTFSAYAVDDAEDSQEELDLLDEINPEAVIPDLNADAFDQEYTIGNLKVTVSYDAGTVPEGTEVIVTDAKPEAVEAIKVEKGEDINYAGADISFVFDGKEIEPKDFSDNKVTVTLEYVGEEDLTGAGFETLHVKETLDEDGTVVYGVEKVKATMTDITETITKYTEVPVYETREITEERTTMVTKTREVEKTKTVKVKVKVKWYDPSTWSGYKYETQTYTVTETYDEPVTETVVVGTEEVQVGTETVEDGTEEIVVGQKAVFETDEFTTYAVVTDRFGTDGNQYVIYTGNAEAGYTALAYSGNSLTTASVTVENGTIVRSNSDNIVWTVDQQNATWRLYHDNRYLQYNRSGGQDSLTTTTIGGWNTPSGIEWSYDSTNHRLSATNGNRTRYLTYNNGTWGLTQNTQGAAFVYIAHVEIEPASGDLTYNYYNADHTASITSAETIAEADYTTTWTDVSTLAKKIDGYQFLEARANSADGDVITQVNGRAYRQGAETSGNGHTLNSIYFIYMKNYVAGEDVIPGLNGPETEKTVTPNEDGTFTIQLDVTGVENDIKHGANVVVVFDYTSSMNERMSASDSTKRIDAAISAVNAMVDTLHPGDPTVEGQYDIDFALVEFARTASDYDFGSDGITGHTNWTKKGSALTTRVGRYANGANLAPSGATEGGGGTNWQAALQAAAAVLENKPDADPTYVVFMTDGNPTIYIGSDSVTNPTSTSSPEYARSVPYATAIVKADYLMYDIFCSAATGTNYLNNLYQTSGAKSYVAAETTTAIENAFKAVADDMLDAIGSSDYGVDDGVPSMGSFDLTTVEGGVPQLSEARYYIKTEEDTAFVEWADAPVATESDAGVLWDLSSVGTLEGDTVYRVEFEIWPSQAAYDLIADLNNQQIYYDFASYQAAGETEYTTEADAIAAGKVITKAQHDQITRVNATTYTMKTNTSLSATYRLYGKTIVDDDIDYSPDAMDLPTETISVKKLWPENMLDEYGEAVYRDEDGNAQTASEIKLTLQREGEDYLEFTVNKNGPDGQATGTYTDDEGVVHDATLDNWSKDDIYVSNGFMTVETVDGKKVVHIKEEGHDYQIVEPEAFLYYWDLISEVYHPMVINGVPTILIYDPDLTEDDVDNETIFAIGMNEDEEGQETTPRIYKKQASASGNTLEASNYRRSNLNLTKQVTTEDTDSLFTYTVTVTDSYSTDGYVWFSAWDPVARDLVYDFDVTGGNVQKETKDIPDDATIDTEAGTCSWTETDGEETWTNTYPIAGEGKYYTGYFFAENGATLTMKIKAGWNVRFLNLYHGTTFSFDETEMPGNYEFDKVEASTQWDIMLESNKDWYEIDEDSTTGLITGTITEPNNNYTVTYTNKPKPEFYIYHSGVAGDGNLEIIPMSDVNADGTYNLYAHTTEGTLYGGYYLDYAGKGDYKDDGVKGSTGVAYTGMNCEWSTPAQTVDGREMKPVAGETYYIKEVPTYYLRNYHQINYVKSSGKLTALYLISAIDDLHYQESGLLLQTNDGKVVSKVTSAMTYRNTATNKSVTLRANSVFKNIGLTGEGSEKNYLTYWDATGSDYFAAGTFTVLPYWITPDGIEVKGASTRTITIGSLTRSGISKNDSELIDPVYGN